MRRRVEAPTPRSVVNWAKQGFTGLTGDPNRSDRFQLKTSDSKFALPKLKFFYWNLNFGQNRSCRGRVV